MARKALLSLLAGLVLGGCSIGDTLFSGPREIDRSRPPANTTEYRCDGDKRFYVRFLDGDGAAWVILPERQFRLDRKGAGEFANATTRLTVKGREATLTGDAELRFVDCKVPENS